VHKHSLYIYIYIYIYINYSKKKQDGSRYIQGGRGSGGREKFRRGGRNNLNRLIN